MILYQAFADLLGKSDAKQGAKFVVISSAMGQITNMLPYPLIAYGTSKAALNFIIKMINVEAPKIAAFPVQ